VAALSAIANGGSLMKPYIVEKITNEKGETVESFQPRLVRKVISEDAARNVTLLLKASTEKEEQGKRRFLQDMRWPERQGPPRRRMPSWGV